jgi:hypothetical protein
MSETGICGSCPHHKTIKGHPSGVENFCTYLAPNGPIQKPIIPIECSGHPTKRPSSDVEFVEVDPEHPLPEDREVELFIERTHEGVLGGPCLSFSGAGASINGEWVRIFNESIAFDPVRCGYTLKFTYQEAPDG